MTTFHLCLPVTLNRSHTTNEALRRQPSPLKWSFHLLSSRGPTGKKKSHKLMDQVDSTGAHVLICPPQPFQVIYIALGTTLERDTTCDEGPQSSPTTGLDGLSCKLPYRHTSLAEKCVFLPRRFLRNLSSTWAARGERDRPRWVSGCSRQISNVFVQVDVSGCFPRSDTRAREKKADIR